MSSISEIPESNPILTRSNAIADLRHIDQRIAWFTQRLATLRMERMMCQMSLGAMRTQADPAYLENIYVAHLCKLHAERASHVEADVGVGVGVGMDTR